jgi:hypothetical protein
MSVFMKSNEKTERLERWQSAKDWHSDGTSTTLSWLAASKDSFNSL